MQGFLDDAAEHFRGLADRHRALTQQYLGKQLQHSALRDQLIQREPPNAGEMTGNTMGKLLEQIAKAPNMRVPYNTPSDRLEEEVQRMRAAMNQVEDKAEQLWNFGQVVFKNRTVEGDDIKKLNMPELVRLAKCKSRDWVDIGKALQQKETVSALEFDSCEDVSLFWGLTPAGDFICESVCQMRNLRVLAISTWEVIQRTVRSRTREQGNSPNWRS